MGFSIVYMHIYLFYLNTYALLKKKNQQDYQNKTIYNKMKMYEKGPLKYKFKTFKTNLGINIHYNK